MKKELLLSLIISIVLGTTQLYAQDKVDYFQKRNEINVQFDDVFARTDIYSLIYLSEYFEYGNYTDMLFSGPSVGIGYKRHFSKGALRVKASIGTSFSGTTLRDSDDMDKEYGFYHEYFGLGYESHVSWGRTQVAFGADIALNFYTAVAVDKANSASKSSGTDIQNKYSRFGIGFKPFLGFKYFITPIFSVSTEYFFLIDSYFAKSVSNVDEANESVIKSTGFNTKFGPKGQLTFSYYF